ncbi:respiratory complex assembly protein rmp1 [Diplodia corticola]|uniref:Respiratory complex assembly protein rmp1 n=1 Tax=Diplodia corticola TaxID=236234 RepID=A0A1J9RUP8_9PEZI|nr:respiratory complex assembly protein rmp1 [Diplodia corticola]OJD32151.1 respiratory complex assembly protein rmp1 [Diplodia corticola]
MAPRRKSVAWASDSLTALAVPKHRRPKFDLQLRILDLNNVPLVSGISYVKWHIPGSAAAEHRGRTERRAIKEHKVFYVYEKHIPVRITIQNKSKMLEDAWMHFEVIQEYSAGGKSDRIVLGKVDLNLAEYVEASELEAAGVVRRYLMQESKINSTLKIGIYMRQIDGDRDYIAPSLKNAQVFGGIAGIIAGEQVEGDESGHLPTLSKNSRADGELQDMYRRTEIAFWAAQPGELRADECIEDIFSGGDGWGNTEGKHMGDRLGVEADSTSLSDSGSRSPLRGWHRVTPSQGSNKSQDTLKKARLLRLGRAPVAPLATAITTSTSSAATFTSTTRRLRASEPTGFSDVAQLEIRRELEQHNPYTPIIRTIESDPATRARRWPREPVRRGRKGQTIKETSAPLRRQYLGEDSEVLILRDLTPLPEKKEEEKQEDDASAPAAGGEDDAARRRREIRETIEASIAGQSAVAGQEEINEQINKLRPVSAEGLYYPAFITREALKDLRKALKNAYAVAQLRRYAAVQEGLGQLRELKREEHAVPSVLWQSAWQQGVSPIEERLPEAKRADVPVEKLPKMQVIDRIVTRLWNVGVIEESMAVGEIEVKLEPWQFDVLTLSKQGDHTILDNIGHQRNIKIDSYRPDHILRFTAEREQSEQAVTDIERVMRQFKVKTFNLEDFEWLRQRRDLERLTDFFSPKDFEVIASLSNTVIDSSSDSSVTIYGVQHNVELAQRLLLSLIGHPNGAETRVLTDAEGEGFLQFCASESALHYRHRKKNYRRWTFPVQRDSVKAEKNQPLDEEPASESLESATTTSTEAHPDHLPDDGPKEAHDVDGQPRLAEQVVQFFTSRLDGSSDVSKEAHNSAEETKKSYWESSALIEFYATFGNVLHKGPSTNDSLSPTTLPNILEHSGNHGRVFLHSIPGFSPYLQHLASTTRLNPEYPDALLFRFMPSPWDIEDSSSLEDFGELGLRIQFDKRTGKARYQGLGLTTRERNVDVLMPEKPIDVRFTHREVVWTEFSLDRSNEIRDYLVQISTSLDVGGTIRAPPSLTFRIPAWAVRNQEKYSSLPFEYTDKGKEYIKEFILTTVEHRQMCRYDLPDGKHRISYTSVEGGRMGGRHGELRARIRRPALGAEQLQKQVPGLVEEAFNVASQINDAVHDRLLLPETKISKHEWHSNIKRLTLEGRFEEPLHANIRYINDDGSRKPPSQAAKEANARPRDIDAPLKAGEN